MTGAPEKRDDGPQPRLERVSVTIASLLLAIGCFWWFFADGSSAGGKSLLAGTLLGLALFAVGLADLVGWLRRRARPPRPDPSEMSPVVTTSSSPPVRDSGGESSDRCVICHQPANHLGQEYNLELSKPGQDSIDIYFCSWSHLQEWVGRGEPNFEYYAEPETWVDRVLSVGCVIVVLAMLGLMTIGAMALIENLF